MFTMGKKIINDKTGRFLSQTEKQGDGHCGDVELTGD